MSGAGSCQSWDPPLVCEARRHAEGIFGMPQETAEHGFIERCRAIDRSLLPALMARHRGNESGIAPERSDDVLGEYPGPGLGERARAGSGPAGVLRTFGERQMMAQLITRRLLVFPLLNKDLRGCLPLLTRGHVASVNPNHQKCARATGGSGVCTLMSPARLSRCDHEETESHEALGQS